MYYFKVNLHNDLGLEEGNMYTLDVTFSGELDYPEGQEPYDPNHEEEEQEDNLDEDIDDQLTELDPSPEKTGCTNTTTPKTFMLLLLSFCMIIRRKSSL